MKIKKAIRVTSLFLTAAIAAASLVFISPVYAEDSDQTLESYQNQIDSLDKQIASNKEKLAEVKSDLKDTKSKYNAVSSQIDQINEQINLLDNKVDVLNDNIAALESAIQETNESIFEITVQIEDCEAQISQTNALKDETREMLLGRIRENYMSGESSTLELLFNCTDISSFFARQELITRVSENDNQLIANLTAALNELDELSVALADEKSALEISKASLDTQVADLQAKQTSLQSSLKEQEEKKSEVSVKQKELSEIINELDETSEEYQTAIKKQEAEREKLNAQIDEYIKAHASKTGDTPDAAIVNDGKMMWPVKGSTKITAGYPAYSNGTSHWGIDIVKTDGTTKGSPFYAAQGGKVIIAVNDGGYNSGFGNYCVIDHGDGKMTLYAHSSSIQCYVGQVVTKGQQIGLIGSTGNTTGPHLHFEVRIKNSDGSVSRVNPLNYVSQP